MFEGKGNLAQRDFYRLRFKLGFVFELVDELFLLFGQVRREEDLGVESRKQLGKLGS